MTKKKKYEYPSFAVIPMETMCSKTGCPGGAAGGVEFKMDVSKLLVKDTTYRNFSFA
ncbi:MAG: hypothetical protein HF982_00990 [Desulfobacteraceae bacterium]|nr:hypothetical protein [Desulfobacteraceae bacterium]MBC2718174.1 hypothetical protein [Desulfobacteraceae bacterium]